MMRRSYFNAFALSFVSVVNGQTGLPPGLEQQFNGCVESQRAGKLDAAQHCLLEVISKGGGKSFVLNNLGIVYQQRSDQERAIALFREAIRLDSQYGSPHYLLGISLLALGKDTEAIPELGRAVQLLPEKNGARIALAKAYERTGNLLSAVDQLSVARDSNPQDPEFAYQLGRAYQKLAEWCFERMKEANPASARVFQVLGESELIQGHHERAIEAFQNGAAADPKLAGSHLALAYIYESLGRRKEALDEAAKEMEVAPGSAAALDMKRKIENSH